VNSCLKFSLVPSRARALVGACFAFQGPAPQSLPLLHNLNLIAGNSFSFWIALDLNRKTTTSA
jgi:hypothetical protein